MNSVWEKAVWPDPFAALSRYPNAHLNAGFDAVFWAKLDERRLQNQTFRGRCQLWFETELGGVAIWRLVGSSLAGALPSVALLALSTIWGAPQIYKERAPIAPQQALLSPFLLRAFWEENKWKKPFKNFDYTLVLNLPPYEGGAPCAVSLA